MNKCLILPHKCGTLVVVDCFLDFYFIQSVIHIYKYNEINCDGEDSVFKRLRRFHTSSRITRHEY